MTQTLQSWARRHKLSLSDAAEAILTGRVRVWRRTRRLAVEAVLGGVVKVGWLAMINANLARMTEGFNKQMFDEIMSSPPLISQLEEFPRPDGLCNIVIQTQSKIKERQGLTPSRREGEE